MARSPVALAYALLLVSLAALLGPALLGIDRLAFRDAGHFYTPLYRYLAEQERQQWLPLYNPLDVTGIPLAGETTTAVFYPLRRLVYWLVPSAETALAWYVVMHLLLASLTVHYAAAVAGARPHGRSLAVIAYPLSGPVLFLYCNPSFLVGAAWAPLALAGGVQLLRQTRPRTLAFTAIGLAMPVLGGDPQITLHVMLIGLAAAIVTLVRGTPQSAIGDRADVAGRGKRALRLFGTLTATAFLAALLACPQLAASLDWARQSIRYSPLSAQHADDIYAFSVAPWHWLELALPAASGQLFPVYTRISHLLTDDGKTWAITLYAGLIPLALTVTHFRRVSRRRLDLWDCLAPLGLVMALGSFGLGYALRTVLPLATYGWDDATGGPYWWLVQFVPGYAGFRYPAKWLVFLPLGIAIGAARQASCLTTARRRQLAHTIFAVAVVASSVAVAIALGLHLAAQQSPELLEISDAFWGPLKWQTAARAIAVSALTVNLIAVAAFWICRRRLSAQAYYRAFVVLIAIDLLIVAWPSVATVSRVAEARQQAAVPPAGAAIREPREHRSVDLSSGRRAMRFVMSHAWPLDWRQVPSTGQERMLAVEASQRITNYGRWHLMEDRAVFNPVTSLPPHRTQAFWRAANALSRQTPSAQQFNYWDRVLGWLAVNERWDVAVVASDLTASTRDTSDSLLDLQIKPVRSPSSHVLWLPEWRVIDEQTWVSPQTFAKRLREISSNQPAPPLIEVPADAAQRLQERLSVGKASGDPASAGLSGAAKIVVNQALPKRWTIRVESTASGLLCLKQFQDGNWTATVTNHPLSADTSSATSAPVFRCDYLFSAVEIPAGNSEVILRYRPRWLLPSILFSGLAWAVVLALLVWPGRIWLRRAMVCPAALR